MAVSLRESGTGANGSSSVSPAAPAGRVAGDLLVLGIGSGEANGAEPTVSAGWTFGFTYINSDAPAYGVDAGPRRVSVYWRIADGTSDDNATVTAGGSGSTRVLSTVIVAYAKTLAEWATLEFSGAGSTTATVGVSHAHTPGWSVDDGDTLVGLYGGVPDTSGFSASTVVWTGIGGTGQLTNRWNSVAGGGNDMRFHLGDRVIQGPSEGNPTFTATTSAAGYGTSVLVRLRDTEGAAPGEVTTRWAGAVTEASAVVAAKVTGTNPVRLAVSTNSGFTSPTTGPQATPDAQGYVKVTIDSLAADTHYYYSIEFFEDGAWRRDTDHGGEFRTFPEAGSATDFLFGHGNCHDSASTNAVFTRIRDAGLLFFLHTGDLQYENWNDGNDTEAARDLWRSSYDEALTVTVQDQMYGTTPVVYLYDDHDYCGDNSDRTSVGRQNATTVYRQCVPHYPLPDSVGLGIWQTFVCGRVRFIMLDTRTYRDPVNNTDTSSKTMLGAEQKQWLKDLVVNSPERQFVIMTGVPWVQPRGTSGDGWGRYDTERQELVDHFDAHGLLDSIVVINGDMHGLAADDGTNSPGNIPTVIGGSLGSSASTKGGPYSVGTIPGNSHYGRFAVDDTGSDINLAWTGRENISGTDTEVMAMAVTLSEAAAAPGLPNFTGEGTLGARPILPEVGFVEVEANSSTVDGTTFTSGAFNVVAGQRFLVSVSTGLVGASEAPTSIDATGAALPLTLVGEQSTANVNARISLWEGVATSTGQTTLTFNFTTAQSWCSWRAVRMSQAGAVAQVASVASAIPSSVSLDAAPSLGSATVSFLLTNSTSATLTPPPGWTLFSTANTEINPSGMGLAAYRPDGEQTAAWTSTNNAQKALLIAEVPFVPAIQEATGAAILTGSGALSATATPRAARSAAFTGAGSLAATAKPSATRPVALDGVGTLSATPAAAGYAGVAKLTGGSSLTIGKITYNYAYNPSAEVSLSGASTASGSQSIELSTDHAWVGAQSFKTYWHTTPATSTSQIRLSGLALPGGSTKTFTIRCLTPESNEVQPNSFPVQLRDDAAAVYFHPAGLTAEVVEGTFQPGQWNTLRVTVDLPADRVLGSLYWRLNVPGRAQTDVYYWDGFQINDSPNEPYFDGDTPPSAPGHPEAYNLCINPSVEVGGGWNSWTPSTSTISLDPAVSRSGVRSRRSDLAAGASTPVVATFAHVGRTDFTLTPVEQGKRYQYGVYVRVTTPGLRGRAYHVERTDAGFTVATTYGEYVDLTPGDWTRVSMPVELTHPSAAGTVLSIEIATADGSNAPEGTSTWVDDAMIVEGDVLLPYFDGSYEEGRWLGATQASVSIRPTERYEWTDVPGRSPSRHVSISGTPGFIVEVPLSGSGSLTAAVAPAATTAAPLSGSGSLTVVRKAHATTTATFTGTGTLTTVRSLSVSRTVAFTGTGTLAGQVTPRTARTVALTGSGVLAAVATLNVANAPNLSGTGTLTVTTVPYRGQSTTFTGSGALTATTAARPTQTASLTGSGSLHVTGVTPTAKPALSLSGSGVLTATTTPRPVRVVALSGSGALAASGRAPTVGQPAALTGAGTLSAAVAPRPRQTATLSGTGTLSTAAATAFTGLAGFTGAGSLATTRAPALSGTAALTGDGTLAATVTPATSRAVALTGAGTLTAATGPSLGGAAVLSGVGSLTATTISQPRQPALFTGAGSLAATAVTAIGKTVAFTGSGLLATSGTPAQEMSLSGEGALTASAVPATTRPVALSGDGTLTAAGTPRRAAALSGSGALTATGAPRVNRAPTFTGDGILNASGMPRWSAAATFTGSGSLTTTGSSEAGASTAFSGSGDLVATARPAPAQAPALTGAGVLTATVAPSTDTTAAFGGTGALAASAAGAALSGLAALSGAGTLEAGGRSTQGVAAALSGTGALTAAGSALTVGQVAGFTGSGALTAAATPAATTPATFTGDGALVVVPSAAGTGHAAFTSEGTLNATGTQQALSAATLTGSGALTATATAAVRPTVALSGDGVLAASGTAAITRTAALTGAGVLAAVTSTDTAGLATLTGTGALATHETPRWATLATLTGAGDLTTITAATVSVDVALSGDGALSEHVTPGVTDAATLSGSGVLTALPGVATSGTTVTLTGEGVLDVDVFVGGFSAWGIPI